VGVGAIALCATVAHVPNTFFTCFIGGGPLGALLALGGLRTSSGLEIWQFLVAIISQEQRLSAIVNKQERTMWDLDFAHVVPITDPISRVLFADIPSGAASMSSAECRALDRFWLCYE
jgi:hypothetical protein